MVESILISLGFKTKVLLGFGENLGETWGRGKTAVVGLLLETADDLAGGRLATVGFLLAALGKGDAVDTGLLPRARGDLVAGKVVAGEALLGDGDNVVVGWLASTFSVGESVILMAYQIPAMATIEKKMLNFIGSS